MKVEMRSYRSRNAGEDPNAKYIEIGPITIWFSYVTPIAFQVDGEERVVRMNDWGATTGKHLNNIDGGNKKTRVTGDEFMRLLQERVGRFFFPRDLDASCPPEVVADWLDDRGMSAAAEAVRANEVEKVA